MREFIDDVFFYEISDDIMNDLSEVEKKQENELK